jgi:hypothetical protein
MRGDEMEEGTLNIKQKIDDGRDELLLEKEMPFLLLDFVLPIGRITRTRRAKKRNEPGTNWHNDYEWRLII